MSAPVTAISAGDMLARFSWSVATHGYRWLESPAGLLLVEQPARYPSPPRTYLPFTKEFATLFQVFAKTPITPDGVLEFANRYGPLGGRAIVGFGKIEAIAAPASDKETSIEALMGNQVRIRPTNALKGELFDGITSRSSATPEKLRSWSWKQQILLMRATIKFSTESTARGHRQDRWNQTRGQSLRWSVNRMLGELVAPRLDLVPNSETLTLTYAPNSLIGALWLQLAMSLSEPKTFKECICGKPIEISRAELTGRRADAMFCSDACKSRDYRNRRNRARDLAAQGWKRAAIVKELRTTDETMRRWLKRERK